MADSEELQLNFQKSAKFNQAVMQQGRLHEQIQLNNSLWINPLSFNQQLNNYHFIIILNNLKLLVREICPKFNKTDRIIILKKIFYVENFVKENPIYKTYTNDDNKKETEFFSDNWNKLSKYLYFMELDVTHLMEQYGFGNPNKEDPYLAATKQ